MEISFFQNINNKIKQKDSIMLVQDLIKVLKELPQDLEVLVGSDDEGNSFRKVPKGWVSRELFSEDLDLIHPDDYDDFEDDELCPFVVIG